jgi:hypothetical protein
MARPEGAGARRRGSGRSQGTEKVGLIRQLRFLRRVVHNDLYALDRSKSRIHTQKAAWPVRRLFHWSAA